MLLDTFWEEMSCVYNNINAFPNKSDSLTDPSQHPELCHSTAIPRGRWQGNKTRTCCCYNNLE